MTFAEVESIIDGRAFLEIGGRLYELIDAAVDCVRTVDRFYFKGVDCEDERSYTYYQLRKDRSLHARF